MTKIHKSIRPVAQFRTFALSGLWLACHVVWAQDAHLQSAQKLMAAKQPAQAYQLLSAQESARAGQPEFDYLLGVAALDSGRITQAIFALERVLAVQPANSLARAELARAYIASGETDVARTQLQQVQASPNVPDAARQSVQRLLSSLDEAAPKRIRFHVEAGLGYDSNQSGGPNLTAFAVPGLPAPLTLGAAAKERGGMALSLGAGVAFSHPLSAQTEVFGNLSARSTQPTSHSDLDTDNLDASIGIATTSGADRYSLALNLGQLNFDGHVFRRNHGLQAQWLRNLDQSSQITAFVQYTQLNFEPNPSNRDVGRTVLGAAWGKALSAQTSGYIGLTLGQEKGRKGALPVADYKLVGLRAGGEHAMSPRMRAFASIGLEDRKHSTADAIFAKKRHDFQTDLAIGLHYLLSPMSYGQWRLTPQLSYLNRNSNIVIHDMKRTQLGITARLDF